jgi:hypothetical protein
MRVELHNYVYVITPCSSERFLSFGHASILRVEEYANQGQHADCFYKFLA